MASPPPPAPPLPSPPTHSLPRPPPTDALYNPDLNAAAGGARTTYTRFAATLDGCPAGSGPPGVAAFDADAFRLTRAEAALMDPHGRLLLEHAAEAVGDARAGGAPAAGGAGTGVYVGCMWATGAQRRRWGRVRVRLACVYRSAAAGLPHPLTLLTPPHPPAPPTHQPTEYVELLPHLGAPDTAAGASTGNTFPFMAGRVSYTYGFQASGAGDWAAEHVGS